TTISPIVSPGATGAVTSRGSSTQRSAPSSPRGTSTDTSRAATASTAGTAPRPTATSPTAAPACTGTSVDQERNTSSINRPASANELLAPRDDCAPVTTAMTSVGPRRAAAVIEKPAEPVYPVLIPYAPSYCRSRKFGL